VLIPSKRVKTVKMNNFLHMIVLLIKDYYDLTLATNQSCQLTKREKINY